MKKKTIYPIKLTQAPNWPQEMKCEECKFAGWKWMGITLALFNFLSGNYSVRKCNKCGVGLLKTSEDGELPVYILTTK